MAVTPFKVVIIGGGPVGLISAHALHKAGMDFVVLERGKDIAFDVGASLVLGPSSLRILHQLGLLDGMRDLLQELEQRKCFTMDGYEFKSCRGFDGIKENHGITPCAFHRAELVQSLYDQLPDSLKSNVLTGKKVVDIQSNESEVKVFCDDGSVHKGNLVLGADGVHSKTRQIMRKLALESNPDAEWDPEIPYTSSYRCMWASFKRPSAPGEGFETQHKDKSAMYLTGKDRGWIFLYEKLSEPTKARTSYTDEDVRAMADRFADVPVNETFKVKDVFADRITSGMSDLQEGICNNWGWGRIVLAGDSIHKACPNAGLGYQNGIQDVVSLVNKLRKLVASSEPSKYPSVSDLESLYKSYQEERWEPLGRDSRVSAHITRIHAWANVWYYLVGRFVLVPRFVDYMMTNWVQAPAMRKALTFNFLDAEEPFSGRVAWVHPLRNRS
ncbi:fad binding domain-containing [Trichoderma arundinaceum]|uniref:Fad binding domain-containing n=1 Tax=Trichoderma arundinaceum TaxID=490622 RepID=A0A395NUR3_TRIAR|nr:fad binding domain-containing [Trichoderma arundinaceum]